MFFFFFNNFIDYRVYQILPRYVILLKHKLFVGIWTYGELPCRQGLGPIDGSHATRGCSLLVAARSSWKYMNGSRLRQSGFMAKHALSFIVFSFIFIIGRTFIRSEESFIRSGNF
jgi:hypothetical protein